MRTFWYDPPGGLDRLSKYCATDVKTELACAAILPEQPMDSVELWRLTTKINERGVYCDMELVLRAKTWAARFERELLEELQDLTGGLVRTAKQTAKLREWLQENGVDLNDVKKESITKALADKSVVGDVRRVLEIRQALAMSSVSKLAAMENMAMDDSRIRGTILYHGASTGRYSGRGIQPQNYPRGTFKDVENIFAALELGCYEFFKALYPNVFAAISTALRGMLRAAPGHRFLAADYNAIEARVVMWLADCAEGMRLFGEDAGVYEEMAADIFSVPVSKVTEDQRFVGKQSVLGCGFGMGPPKFVGTCASFGKDVPLSLGKKAVYTYREKFHEVPTFWKEINDGVIEAVKTKKRVTVGRLQLLVKGRFLYIRLPSGRKLAYYDPQIRWVKKKWGMQETLTYMAVHPKTKAWYREETYGGKITENVVQAIAADIMTAAMARLEKAGYPIVLTVHDELVSEVLGSFGTLAEFEKLMAELPAWADGLPVKVKGWMGKRFKK